MCSCSIRLKSFVTNPTINLNYIAIFNYFISTWDSMNNFVIEGSSFAVIHQIPGVLNHTALNKNKEGEFVYPDFNSVSECKAYLKKFATPNDIKKMKHYE